MFFAISIKLPSSAITFNRNKNGEKTINMYAIRITSPSIIVCVKKDRCGITFYKDTKIYVRNPICYKHYCTYLNLVLKMKYLLKPIAKVNKNQNLLIHTKRENKTTGRDIKFIFVCVLPDGIMHFLAYVRPVTL